MKQIFYSLLSGTVLLGSVSAFAIDAQVSPELKAQQVKMSVKGSAKRVNAYNTTPVTQPFGEKFKVAQDGYAYYMVGGRCYYTNVGGLATHMVDGYDGKLYLYNPITNYDARTYVTLEPRKNSDGETEYVMPLPQLYFNFESTSGQIPYYVDRVYTSRDELGNLTFNVDEEVREIVYKLVDGEYIMQTPNEDGRMVGLGLIEGNYNDPTSYTPTGFLELNSVYKVFKDKLLKAPKDLETEPWTLVWCEGGDEENNGHNVRVGFVGDDMYIQGLMSAAPESWIKAKVNGNSVTFPSKQYIGEVTYDGSFQQYYSYFMGIKLEFGYVEGKGEVYSWYMKDEITLDYDPEKKEITTTMFDGFLANNGTAVLYYGNNDLYQHPRLYKQGEITDFVPMNPQILNHIAYNANNGYEGVKFWVPKTNNSAQILEGKNMYFVAFIDDTEEPFTFYTDEYRNLSRPMTLIPIDFTENYDFGLKGLEHTLYFYMEDISFIGVMSIYDDGENYHYSQIVPIQGAPIDFEGEIARPVKDPDPVDPDDPTDSVENISVANDVVSAEYYDLAGRMVVNPDKGVYVLRQILKDGTIKTLKVAIK